MGKRFGIGALAVAALIAAGPASAQLSAKPAVGTVIGVQSATMLAFEDGEMGYIVPGGPDLYVFLICGSVVGYSIYAANQNKSNPNSP
jgi:hypothetical protein